MPHKHEIFRIAVPHESRGSLGTGKVPSLKLSLVCKNAQRNDNLVLVQSRFAETRFAESWKVHSTSKCSCFVEKNRIL